MRKFVAVIVVFCVMLGSCYKNNVNTNTCDYDPCATMAPAYEVAALESYLASVGVTTATRHCSGMYYEIVAPGADKQASICSNVMVNYTGTLADGTVFDKSGATPSSFTPVTLIEGWKKGLLLIKKGGRIKLYVPPSLGYGAEQHASIPGNSILIFDIELVDVQ